MFLTKVKPNWRHIHALQGEPFIHFNLHTFDVSHQIPYDFMKSYNDLPPDDYVPMTYNGATRSRRYANLKIDVTNNYEYSIYHTTNDTFKQKVDDSRSIERTFPLMELHHLNQPWMTNFVTQISALSVLNHNYYKGHKKIKEVDIHLHQVRQTTYEAIEAHNSPEGIHRDGADYIISAFVIHRNNIVGGESIIYDQNKMITYKAILDDKEGLYQEDIKQWHYVTPIQIEYPGIGFRDIVGIDIILHT